jgi:catalase
VANEIANPELAGKLLEALDALSGLHPGFRAAHAKGRMCVGVFSPAPQAASLTRAPHANRPTTPVTVRFSNSTGLPDVPDNDPGKSSPRGMAIRFHLGEHVHTDVIAHSTDGFPVRTGEEFLEFLRAAAAAGGGKPEAMGAFLAGHPAAKRFLETPKPIPTSFAREAYFAMTAFAFTNAAGETKHGRFRLHPEGGPEHLSDAQAAAKGTEFLFEEIKERLERGPAHFGVTVQIAGPGDDPADASEPWPAGREEIPFGEIALLEVVDDQIPVRRRVIFDPDPRIDGISDAGDPLTAVRADVYLLAGRRRREALGDGTRR